MGLNVMTVASSIMWLNHSDYKSMYAIWKESIVTGQLWIVMFQHDDIIRE